MTMKRSNLLWATALLLAGCSNSDELGGNPEVSENAITFDQPFVRKSTRTTGDLNTTTITATTIRVWGDKHTASGGTVENVFDATSASDADVSATLSCTGADKSWACSKIAFWEATYAYDFTAVAPSDVTATYPTSEPTVAARKLTVSSIPVVQTISNADGSKQGDDILVANANNLTAGGVQLSFKHILSRFSVYAYTKVAEATPVTITALKLYLPVSTATATYAQNTHGTVTAGSDAWTWTGFGNKENATATTELVTNYTGYDIVTTATGALPVCSNLPQPQRRPAAHCCFRKSSSLPPQPLQPCRPLPTCNSTWTSPLPTRTRSIPEPAYPYKTCTASPKAIRPTCTSVSTNPSKPSSSTT